MSTPKSSWALTLVVTLLFFGTNAALMYGSRWLRHKDDPVREEVRMLTIDDCRGRADARCVEYLARWESMSGDDVVTSKFGRSYYGGEECFGNCATIKAGFDDARTRKLENPWECTGSSQAHLKGCHLYLEEHSRYDEN